MANKKIKLIGAMRDQSTDQGLMNGKAIVAGMEAPERAVADALTRSVGEDLARTITLFSANGTVGRTFTRIAPQLAGVPNLRIPSLDSLGSKRGNTTSLMAALFDPQFQKALYRFQLVLSRSDLEVQQELIKRYTLIDWSRFNFEDQTWFQKQIGLIGAGVERKRVCNLQLQDVIPLMRIPQVLDMIILSSGYAEMMKAAMRAYVDDRDFLREMGNDNDAVLAEIDSLLERIKKAEFSRLARLEDVREATDDLKRLMEVATLVANLTNRSTEAEAQKKAGERLADALRQHSQDTLESQEAFLQQFMRLNQILVSNQVREGRLESAMAALGLYVKSYQAFVLMLTSLQVYLLTASSVLKTYLKESVEGSSRAVVEKVYEMKVLPLNSSVLKYSSGFNRIKPGESRRNGVPKAVLVVEVIDDVLQEDPLTE